MGGQARASVCVAVALATALGQLAAGAGGAGDAPLGPSVPGSSSGVRVETQREST